MTHEAWGQVQEQLRRSVGQSSFKSWIEPLEFDRVSEGVARFKVPTGFFGTWVSRHYGDLIVRGFAQSGSPVDRLDFALVDAAPPAPKPSPARSDAAPARPRAEEHDNTSAPLDPSCTFDEFVVGKSNALAHAAARRVASATDITFNPLFLYGSTGLGKTHLMHAIAWKLRTERPDLRVVYLSAEKFMMRFVEALRMNGTMKFKELFRSVDILMVDDIQFIAGKDSTQEEFFHTFNALVDQRKQIVLSADRAPGDIKKLEDRIASRMQSGLVVDLLPTDYELRLGILQQKAELYRSLAPGFSVQPDVLEFMARRISADTRTLEGALKKLIAHGGFLEREITLEVAQDCLSDTLRSSEKALTIEEIQRAVSEHFAIRLSDMIGPKRLRAIARPRQVAMYICKDLTSRSLPEIGRRFGGRDHTTVIHAVKRIQELMVGDRQLAEDIDILRRRLQS
ncbi:chromosomal replication initiator protein DnaA [Tropicimonas sp. IMCC34011]|uniref:chromosomal replication initiator protein DnaA n=1 Tax=Tropicimonas sp. IMCC34011 TaxID=2248759 RepID=UPI000E28266F|nr:chromosomal replication initiator protein DnaA [Tropicimonas sp. IMCC34011]